MVLPNLNITNSYNSMLFCKELSMNRKLKKICRLRLALCLCVSFTVFVFLNVFLAYSLKFVNSGQSLENKIEDLQNAHWFGNQIQESKRQTNDNITTLAEHLQKTMKSNLTKIVDVTTIAEKNFTTFPCRTASLGDRSFPICLYTKDEDIWVSKTFYEGKYWEGDLVSKIVHFLEADKDLEFIDIGANVGSYTLPAAHAGFRVIAVEPNTATLQRLAQSIYLGNITQKVILLQNAISNEHSSTILGRDAQNQGNTFLVRTNSCTPITDPNCLSTSVQTILLDDLLPLMSGRRAVIKIDVQGSEIRVFDPRTSFKFFSEVEVEVIQMEWEKYIGGKHEESAVKSMLAGFRHRKYVPHDAKLKRLANDWKNWPVDIFFLKGKALESVGVQ